MDKNMNLENERLIADLKKRLKWYQEEAKPEEINAKEIEAILTLLDELEPLEVNENDTEEKAYARFEERYFSKMPAQNAPKNTAKKVWKYIGLTAASIIGLFTILNVGTYATAGKGFFEFITQSTTGRSFFVSGNRQEGEEETMGLEQTKEGEYGSWEELPPELLEQICVPAYVPEGLTLERISYVCENYTDIVRTIYVDELDTDKRMEIWIEEYGDANAWQQGINAEAEFVEERIIEGRECFFYQYEDKIMCYYFEKSQLYTVLGEYEMEEICTVVKNMQ